MIDFKSRPSVCSISNKFNSYAELLELIEHVQKTIESGGTITIKDSRDQYEIDVNDIIFGFNEALTLYEKQRLIKEQELKVLIYGNEFLQDSEVAKSN